MKGSYLCFAITAIYAAPHMTPWVALALAFVFLCIGALALSKGD